MRPAVRVAARGVQVAHRPTQEAALPDDTELLEQRVIKRKQKLEEAAAVVSMIQERLASASTADEEAGRELRTLRAALKSAEKKAKRLKKRTKQAEALAGSVEQDRLLAERELGEELQSYEKRQGKLAKAEAALAAARATQRVDDVAPPEATPAKKSPARKSTTAKRTATTKQAAPRKRAAAAKKTTSTTGRTTSTASTAKKTTAGAASTASTAKKTTARKTAASKAPARKTTTRQPRKTT
jgi:DNA repair exonuclease SbcCD ATPase subunit